MAGKIDRDLKTRLDRLARTDPDTPLPLIITLKPDRPATALRAKGFRVDREFPVISAVAGQATPRQALELAALDEVVKVEYDGQFHAI